MHDKKNADYAGSEDSLANLRMCEKMGLSSFIGVVVRLSDKFCRLMRFCKTKELAVKDESIKDTLKDIVNYAIFAIIFLAIAPAATRIAVSRALERPPPL